MKPNDLTNDKFITQEIGDYEHKLAYLSELKGKVAEAVTELETTYANIINAKGLFEDFKKQNIDEVRRYKFAIAQEEKEIVGICKRISTAMSSVSAKEVDELAKALKALHDVASTPFFKRFADCTQEGAPA